MKARDLLAAGTVCLAATLASVSPPCDRLSGLSVDALFWLRHQVADPAPAPTSSSVAVIAIDEETYRRPPFVGLPKVMWTPQLAKVLSAVVGADAGAVGLDVILPTSVERLLSGYDRDFLLALRQASQKNKIVLAKVQHQVQAIGPDRGQSFAVGNARNIRAANLEEDRDGVIRRLPLWFRAADQSSGERREPSLALDIAARTAGAKTAIAVDGAVTFAGRPIPGTGPGADMLLNFDTRQGAIPTYSLADLLACAERGDTAYFRRHFAGKAVLIGAVLDVEDRKTTSMRFATSPEGVGQPDRCALPVMVSLYRAGLRRDTIPGVYVHATAIDNLLHGSALRETGGAAAILAAAGLVVLTVAAVLALPAWGAGAAGATLLAVWAVIATAAFRHGVVLPLLQPMAAVVVAFVLSVAYRFTVADRDKRFLRRAFASYVSPNLVEELVRSPEKLGLGGERRECSFVFTDLAGFTSLVEKSDPETLLPVLNRYIDGMTSIVFKHQGTLDKIVGDAVPVFFSAPVAQPDHRDRAIACALDMDAFSQDFRAREGRAGIALGITRIGVNTGDVVVGNFGGANFFDYRAHGDAVNTAARLETANKHLGTRLLVAGATVRGSKGFVGRPVADLLVVGKSVSVDVWEPLTPDASWRGYAATYSSAYEDLKVGGINGAETILELAAEHPDDPVLALHARRIAAGETGVLVTLGSK